MSELREWFIKRLEIPIRSIGNRKIPKKAFFNQGDLSKAEKELFTSEIEGIYLLSVMNQQSVNIPVYKTEEINYSEVVWIYIHLRFTQNYNRIVSAVHKCIPNPVVLIMESPEKKVIMSTCHKRLNKYNMSKVVADQPIITSWFQPKDEEGLYNKLLDALNILKLSFNNLYEFYDDINQWLQCEETISLVDVFPINKESRERVVKILNEVKDLKKEVKNLEQKQKDQLEFGVKMDFYIKINLKEQQITQHLNVIRNLCWSIFKC